ncbi:pyridoxal phosphate-dependent transferase [Stachybotrys elegans]|uniref:Pyridoxal phosphate-dependent transferase n=1 Tax=Stachybotrys elegans TaxID=80388 RepID=A0A8K0SZK7_9HYPO|nr:pyridoxal phosphate-dependent transferase [Stachybotrys elegans]
MVVLKTKSEFGHAPPPATAYSIITNLPGWDLSKRVRDGDMSPLARIVNIYPRFTPTQHVAALGQAIAAAAGREGYGAMLYLSPDMWAYTLRHITNKGRGEHVMRPEDVDLRCFDIAGHRVYAVLYQRQHTPGIMMSWGNPGLGLSIRGAEALLGEVQTLVEAPAGPAPPPPTWTHESSAHAQLRERICELLHRAAPRPELVKCAPRDVFLYPSGMGAIWYTTRALMVYRPGTIVVLGIVFHNTYHHLQEEYAREWKHFGDVRKEGVDELEAWLQSEKEAGRPVSFVLVEVPGNPNLETPDLARVKRLSETYGFVLVVDDTLGGFANLDVMPYSDIILTSLTKSFNGYADLLAGSIVLNPLSLHYAALSPLFTSSHRNELFAADAEVLVANSRDFIERTKRLDSNAQAMASFLSDVAAADPASHITGVQYPSLIPESKAQYDALKRRGTPELPAPGYGCVFTVEFDSEESARAFYDACGFYPSPHLGAPVTLMFAYNMFVFKPREAEYLGRFGVRVPSVRISAGLEPEEDLIDTLKDALEAVRGKAKEGQAQNGGEVNGH